MKVNYDKYRFLTGFIAIGNEDGWDSAQRAIAQHVYHIMTGELDDVCITVDHDGWYTFVNCYIVRNPRY